ncbi:MAG TPA: tetratricopeptide repeat protein, partial [Candidatus Acidoferrum sp.]|nr:tetratricopeptide repeat protein [Candidatus Acidoferrum sp.]
MRQGKYEEALSLLAAAPPAQLANSETAVWRKLTESSSATYLSRYLEAQRYLAEAQALASAVQPQLLGEVYLRQGTLASVLHEMPVAQAHFRSCLQFARSHHDPFLEASALGSLGVSAERMEHHDESIDWNRQALGLIQANAWHGLAAKVEGNPAWSYFELGDYEKALDQYRTAEQRAIRAGLDHERVLWLASIADTSYALGDYSSARGQAREALELAVKLGDPVDIVNSRQHSALIAMRTGAYDEARGHLEEAVKLEAAAPDAESELYTRFLSARLAVQSGDPAAAALAYSAIAGDRRTPSYLRWEVQAGLAQLHASAGKTALAEREFLEALQTFSSARKSINEDYRLSFISTAIRFYDAYVNFLIKERRPGDALRAAELSRAQTLEEGFPTREKAAVKAGSLNAQ